MSAEEQSDESKHQQKKGWHASHSFQPSTCQSTRYERIEYWRTTRSTMALQDFVEEVQVLARDLVDRVRSLIQEGNVQRIIIKDVHGNTFVEIPVSVAAIGVILAPVLAAVGSISALVAKFTIVVQRA